MTICDHQFHGGDASDWILSTSVGCLDGSTTASRILRELFRKHRRNMTAEGSRKRPKTVATDNIQPAKSAGDTKTPSPGNKSKPEETLIVRKIPGVSNFENFDESQHLNGCPMKWLYNKKLMERNKKLKTERLCCKKSPPSAVTKKERTGNLRDRTPIEVKIHKINLTEKYANSGFYLTTAEGGLKDLETRRKKLAEKLNWKLHDDAQDDSPFDVSSDTGFRHDYFPPRPLLGLKPLLSVLLAPHTTNCSCFVVQLQGNASTGKGREPSLSVQSLDLPLSQEESKPRPKTTNGLRWGSKSVMHMKKLQIPNQITIKLEQKEQKKQKKQKEHKTSPEGGSNLKAIRYNPPVKRKGGGRNQTKSLSSLCYELKGKTSYRVVQSEEVLEEMIRDLTSEGQFKMKRFLNLGVENSEVVGWGGRRKAERREKSVEGEALAGNESDLVCERVRFFRKKLPGEGKTANCAS